MSSNARPKSFPCGEIPRRKKCYRAKMGTKKYATKKCATRNCGTRIGGRKNVWRKFAGRKSVLTRYVRVSNTVEVQHRVAYGASASVLFSFSNQLWTLFQLKCVSRGYWCNICSNFIHRTSRSCSNHSQEPCEWLMPILGSLWVG